MIIDPRYQWHRVAKRVESLNVNNLKHWQFSDLSSGF
jgi:hypothetical protein